MKPKIRPFLALALPLCLPLASAARAQSVTTWAQSYGVAAYDANGQPVTGDVYGSGTDTPVGIAPMPDGGVVVAGQLDLPKFKSAHTGERAPAALVRYGKDGAILWQFLLRQDNNTDSSTAAVTRVIGVRTDAAGNIFIAGNGNYGSSGLPSFVAKFSPDGALLWQNGYSEIDFLLPDRNGNPAIYAGGVSSPTTMDLTADGGVVVGGGAAIAHDNNNVDNHSGPMIVKFNADGSLGFHREYENPIQYSNAISVCARPGGTGYALLLQPNPFNAANNGTAVVVVLTDTAGNPVSQRTFSADGYGGTPRSIRASADGGFLFLSTFDGRNGNGSQVHKLNADLSPVWQTQLHNCGGANLLTPTPDGGCIIGGAVSVAAFKPGGSNVANALLLTLDGTGVLTSAHLLGGTKGEGAPLTCQTTDGATAFAATTLSYNTGELFPDWWVVKADASGKVPGFADNMVDPPLSLFAAGPSSEPPSFVSNDYGPAPANEANPSIVTGGPGLVLENLANETGVDKPTVKFQAAPTTGSGHAAFFAGESALGGGAYYLQFPSGNPFGYYSYLSDTHYIYHFDLGYEYVFEAGDSRNGVYLYDFKSGGFFYTSPSFPFPYLYDFALKSTVYYYPDPNNTGRYNTDGVRYFYVFNTGQIISK